MFSGCGAQSRSRSKLKNLPKPFVDKMKLFPQMSICWENGLSQFSLVEKNFGKIDSSPDAPTSSTFSALSFAGMTVTISRAFHTVQIARRLSWWWWAVMNSLPLITSNSTTPVVMGGDALITTHSFQLHCPDSNGYHSTVQIVMDTNELITTHYFRYTTVTTYYCTSYAASW